MTKIKNHFNLTTLLTNIYYVYICVCVFIYTYVCRYVYVYVCIYLFKWCVCVLKTHVHMCSNTCFIAVPTT